MSQGFAALTMLAQQNPGAFNKVPRTQVVDATREHLESCRQAIRKRHNEGASGGNVVTAITGLADEMMNGVIAFALCFVPNAKTIQQRTSIIAVGGYGRRQLNPFSDLDLGIICKRRVDKNMRAMSEYMVPFLWDIGYNNSCVLRTVKDCLTLAREDTRVLTGLLESRLLYGDPGPFSQLGVALSGLRKDDIPERYNELIARSGTTRQAARDELFDPEPNIKESPGALRDYHTALWLGTLGFGANTQDKLAGVEIITRDQNIELAKALDLMWRIRNELHFSAGKGEDRLTLESIPNVAAALGYTESDGTRNRLMEDYYAAAREIRRFLRTVARYCESPTRYREPARDRAQSTDVVVRNGELFLVVDDKNWFAENPARLMALIWECARHEVPLSQDAQRMIRENLHLAGDTFRSSDLVRRFFLAACNRPFSAGLALREAADSGLLDCYLPEFNAIKDIIRYEDFHHFPVDEHTLRAVEALRTIPAMDSPVGNFLNMAVEHLQDPYILVMALLFHDLGKVHGEEHSVAGMKIAREIGERIGLPPDDIERIAFLVEHHLLMTKYALYRDIDDEETVRQFAGIMKSDNRLRTLFLLSFADMTAVGPNVWTEWKGTLLLNLYLKTEKVLLGLSESEDEAYWLHPKTETIRDLLPEDRRDAVESHVRDLGERYFVAFTAPQIASHLESLWEAQDTGFAMRVADTPHTGVTDLVVCSRDRPGLFGQIAGCMAAQLIDVRSAAAFTRSDGFTLDTFSVVCATRNTPLSEAQIRALDKTLRKVLIEGEDVVEHMKKARQRIFGLLQEPVPVPTRIEFDNETSRDWTVIDVQAADRTGLLYDIVSCLNQKGFDIASARIVTDARRVRDAFYVTRNHAKLETQIEQDETRMAINDAVRAHPASTVQGGTR